jgi:hypothetical protein
MPDYQISFVLDGDTLERKIPLSASNDDDAVDRVRDLLRRFRPHPDVNGIDAHIDVTEVPQGRLVTTIHLPLEPNAKQ